jgi:hypothetical protein
MRLIIAMLVLLCCSQLCAQPSTQPTLRDDVKLDLFLLAGQSNMAGRGKVEPQDQVVHPRIWVLNKDKQWAPAVDPLHWDRPERIGVGPAMSFARAVAEKNPGIHIGLIPTAVGSTSVDQWKKGGELYENAISRAKLAMQHGQIKAILWHQGEADGLPERLADYPAKLRQLVLDFRTDLASPDLPFVMGQIGEFYTAVHPDAGRMNQILMAFPRTIRNAACASSAGLTQMGDNTHFDAAGARELGKRYAELYFQLTR